MDWSKYPNFSEREFKCKYTGACKMDEDFMDKLQALRTEYGRPLTITSGYRHPTGHPVERRKGRPGAHSMGMAADIACSGHDAHEILYLAMRLGFTGIGVSQKGDSRFLHLDTVPHEILAVRPNIWSY
jgi:zinc D-Ala-D-Ala carboxypeptidase